MIVITNDADALIKEHSKTKLQDFARMRGLMVDRNSVISLQGAKATLVMQWYYNKLYETPSVIARLSSVATAIFGTNGKMSGPTLVDSRRMICGSCPLFSSSSTQCRRCTCYMNIKWHIKDMACPLSKW